MAAAVEFATPGDVITMAAVMGERGKRKLVASDNSQFFISTKSNFVCYPTSNAS
jgi:hypothetical protein